MKKNINIGERHGRLTIIKELSPIIYKPRTYERRVLCICDCGKEVSVSYRRLLSGYTTSCGCFHKERFKYKGKYPKEATSSRLYNIWNSMKERCYCIDSTSYPRYGAKGITVCEEWKNDYMAFYNWAISNGYSDDLTIDRIDSKGNYEPSNCRWATYKEQANNTCKVKRYSFNGETHTPREWEEIVGIKWQTIRYRIKILGWPIEKALTVATQKRTKL